MEKYRKKKKIFSSFVPLILIILIGGVIGNKILQENNTEGNNIINNIENSESSNIIENKVTENIVNQIETHNTDHYNQDANIAETNEIKNESSSNSSNNSELKFDSTVAFIGDSRTQGFIMYNGLKNVQDYSYIGLMVDTAITKQFVKTSNGNKITLLQDMANKNIKKVYIMLGVNELGWSYPQVFKAKYKELISEINKVKPNCKIYLQSIIPMTKSKSDSDKIYNNKNVAKFNQLIKEVAEEENVTYLDVKSVLVNKDGYLPEEASTDGVHIDKKYCKKWLDYLKNNS